MQEGRLRFHESKGLLGPRDAIGQFVFVPDDGDDFVLNLASVSYFCRSCETLVAPGMHEGLKCFECHADIDEGAEACPRCGWTWR